MKDTGSPLICFYSKSGHTQRAAHALASKTGADVVRLEVDRYTTPGLWFFRAVWDVGRGTTPPLKSPLTVAADTKADRRVRRCLAVWLHWSGIRSRSEGDARLRQRSLAGSQSCRASPCDSGIPHDPRASRGPRRALANRQSRRRLVRRRRRSPEPEYPELLCS